MVLAPDCRRISSETVGTPLSRESERCSFVPFLQPGQRAQTDREPSTVAITSRRRRADRLSVREFATPALPARVYVPRPARRHFAVSASRTVVMGI